MLALILPISFAFILLNLIGMGERLGQHTPRWQGNLLIASGVWGALLVVVTELLSLFEAIAWAPLALGWSAIVVLLVVVGWRNGSIQSGITWLHQHFPSSWIPLFVMASLFAVLLAVALVAPPNNVDTLQYHMPRVVHWAQDQSLRHYAVTYDSQNTRPYWTELVILNLRVMWGNDRPANLVPWSSFLGTTIAASGIAAALGGSRKTQWLAASVAFSIPMAILQATTPKNDVTSAFWVMSAAYFVVLATRRELRRSEHAGLAASFALGLLTKGTVLPFLAPLALWYTVTAITRRGWWGATRSGLLVVALIVATNMVFWARNMATYGGPFGANIPIRMEFLKDLFETSSDRQEPGMLTGLADDGGAVSIKVSPVPVQEGVSQQGWTRGVRELATRLARMMAMHFVSPFGAVNRAIISFLRQFPGLFSPGFIQSLEAVAWNNAMLAGNPVHLVMFFACGVGVQAQAIRRRRFGPVVPLMLAAIVGYVLVSFSGCSTSTICLRYQISFFYLTAPIIALFIGSLGDRANWLAIAGFMLYALPYIAINNMRPVIGHTPWPTRVQSVFVADRAEVLFAQSPDIRDEYEHIARVIRGADCGKVGLSLETRDLEYPHWWLLDAPQSGISIKHLRSSPPTEKYLDPTFNPCAAICTACEGVEDLTSLPLQADYGHVRLYLEMPGSGDGQTTEQ